MKKKNIILALVISVILVSCSSLDKQPPVNEGYKTEFVMPKGELLSDEDREYLNELEKEYEQNT